MARAASRARNSLTLSIAAKFPLSFVLVSMGVALLVVKSPASGEPNAGRKRRPCHYIRGQGRSRRLDGLQIVSRRLAGPAIGDDFVADLLAFVEIAHSGALDRTDVHEHVLAAVIRLNEAKTFLAVKPLHGSRGHGSPFFE